MTKSIMVNQKKRGRPATGRDPVSAVRLPNEISKAVDEWATIHDSTRSEAIRRLVELGLTVKPKARPRADTQKDRAKELAGKAVDQMADVGASADDRANRRRRILEGPSSFRDVRVDRPKAKK